MTASGSLLLTYRSLADKAMCAVTVSIVESAQNRHEYAECVASRLKYQPFAKGGRAAVEPVLGRSIRIST